ncbi:mCG145023, partial [Mus musculus]
TRMSAAIASPGEEEEQPQLSRASTRTRCGCCLHRLPDKLETINKRFSFGRNTGESW